MYCGHRGPWPVYREARATKHGTRQYSQPPQTALNRTVSVRVVLHITSMKGPCQSQMWMRKHLANSSHTRGQLKSRRRTLLKTLSTLQAPQASAERTGEPVSISDDGTVDGTTPSNVSKRASQSLKGEPGTGNQLPAQHLDSVLSVNREQQFLLPYHEAGMNSQHSSPPFLGILKGYKCALLPKLTSQVCDYESESKRWNIKSKKQQ